MTFNWLQQVCTKVCQIIPWIANWARPISSGVWDTHRKGRLHRTSAILTRSDSRPPRKSNRCQKKRNWLQYETGRLKKREAPVTHQTSKKIKILIALKGKTRRTTKKRRTEFWVKCGVGLANCLSWRPSLKEKDWAQAHRGTASRLLKDLTKWITKKILTNKIIRRAPHSKNNRSLKTGGLN